MSGLAELERDRLKALKDMVAIATKEPQCKCEVDPGAICSSFECGSPFWLCRNCGHDRACHAPKDGE